MARSSSKAAAIILVLCIRNLSSLSLLLMLSVDNSRPLEILKVSFTDLSLPQAGRALMWSMGYFAKGRREVL